MNKRKESIPYKGEYSNLVTYNLADSVSHGGILYIVSKDVTDDIKGTIDITNTTYFNILANPDADIPTSLLSNSKTYRILITQTSTNNPVVNILQDTITNVVVTRSTVGTSLFTKVGGFPMLKSAPKKVITYFDTADNKLVLTHVSNDQYKLETYAASNTSVLADGVLIDQEIELNTYNS